ncbi:ParB/RepB/Spo0J family partition protein [Streptomyces sp. NPDC002795]|uniref:ParB/RepB/Spo0J family partition protein n=1 Tax=Streptomyces sp. NPDC002795 TaxID=3364665 RepID=UPI00369DCEF8
MAIRTLSVEKIHRNETQPREHFDQERLQELAASIERFGLMQPIEVRRDREAGGYQIVSGERRWRAHGIAGLTEIKATIIDDDESGDDLEMYKRSISENINRADMTPLEEAKAFKRLLDDEEDATPASVAKEFGKSVQFVNLRLALLNLTDEIREHVNSGAIGTQAAVQIAALTPGNQRAVLAKWAKGAFAGDNELVHFAYALRQQQDQVVAMIVEDMSPEEKEERKREREATRKQLDKVEQLANLLDELTRADPAKLAVALEGEVGARLDQVDRVAELVGKARFVLRQAKAHAEAREIAVNPEANAPVRGGQPQAPADQEPQADAEQAPADADQEPQADAGPERDRDAEEA